jgi:hypothetical protein
VNQTTQTPNTAPPEPTARDKMRDASAAAGEHMSDVGDSLKSGAADAQAAVADKADEAKDAAVDEIDRTAHGLEVAADEMQGSPVQQDLLREAADGLKQISHAMQGKSLGEMVEELSDFGRRNPLAYLGGATMAGFALARFARASTPAPDRHRGYTGSRSYTGSTAGGTRGVGAGTASQPYPGQPAAGTGMRPSATPSATPAAGTVPKPSTTPASPVRPGEPTNG